MYHRLRVGLLVVFCLSIGNLFGLLPNIRQITILCRWSEMPETGFLHRIICLPISMGW